MTLIERYKVQRGIQDRYSLIIDTDDIYNSFILAHRDLSYPLRKEVKRDRYVMNSQGLKKDIEKVVNECLEKQAKPLIDTVSTEIARESYRKLEEIHNTGTIKTSYNSNSLGSLLGKNLVKGITSGISRVLDDMTNN